MNFKSTFFILIIFPLLIRAQIDSLESTYIDIYIIDSYITPEQHNFVLSFFTGDSCKSKILFDSKEMVISDTLTKTHKIEINLNGMINNTSVIKYKILLTDKNNHKIESQIYEVEIPGNILSTYRKDVSLMQVCCFGGIFFGLPSPTLVFKNNQKHLSLTKEIPVFSFYKGSYNYPFGYIGIEYSYIFKEKENFLRAGYKQLIQLNFIKYISFGLNYFMNFKGYNGISSELSLGLFQIQNVFTAYVRYRYNFQPDRKGTDFHEASIGIYSNFFSINL